MLRFGRQPLLDSNTRPRDPCREYTGSDQTGLVLSRPFPLSGVWFFWTNGIQAALTPGTTVPHFPVQTLNSNTPGLISFD